MVTFTMYRDSPPIWQVLFSRETKSPSPGARQLMPSLMGQSIPVGWSALFISPVNIEHK